MSPGKGGTMNRIARCKGCGGVQETGDDGQPWGWYSLSVNVPPRLGKNGKPFLWVGMWCSMLCLSGDLPLLGDQEELARMAYDADLPVPAGSAAADQLVQAARGGLRAVR